MAQRDVQHGSRGVQHDTRAALTRDLDVGECHIPQLPAKGLDHSLFGSPPSGQPLHAASARGEFLRREDARQEVLPQLLDLLSQARHVDDVGADPHRNSPTLRSPQYPTTPTARLTAVAIIGH